MQFKINLATRTYINKKKLDTALTAAMIILLFLLLVQAKISVYNAGEMSRLNSMQTSEEAQSKKKRLDFSESDYKKLLADIKFANGIIERKAFDWLGPLNRLESVVPEGVTLTSLEPNSKERNLKISGIALNFGNIRHFMENLEGSNSFSDVYLEKHDESKSLDSRKTISFAITCKFAS